MQIHAHREPKRRTVELCDLIKLQELCVREMNNSDFISEKWGEKEAKATEKKTQHHTTSIEQSRAQQSRVEQR